MRWFRRDPPVERLLRRLEKRDWVTDTEGRLIDVARAERLWAVQKLGAIDDARARAGLVQALGDPAAEVRAAALDALAESGDPSVAGAYAETIVADERRDRLADHEADALRRLLQDAGDTDAGAALVGRLLPHLASTDPSVRVRAQRVLAALPDHAVDHLVTALGDPDTRRSAAETLGELRDVRSIDALVELLENGDTEGRIIAAEALGAIRGPQAAEPLMRASGDREPRVRDAAQNALDRLGMMGVVVGVAKLVQPLVDRIDHLERVLELPPGNPPDVEPPSQAG